MIMAWHNRMIEIEMGRELNRLLRLVSNNGKDRRELATWLAMEKLERIYGNAWRAL